MKSEKMWITKSVIKEISEKLGDSNGMFIDLYKDDDMAAWKFKHWGRDL